jgi:hypothetical protein
MRAGGTRERWSVVGSFTLCAAAMIVGTILYPLILLLFAAVAVGHPVVKRVLLLARGSGGDAAKGETGR